MAAANRSARYIRGSRTCHVTRQHLEQEILTETKIGENVGQHSPEFDAQHGSAERTLRCLQNGKSFTCYLN
jgi:hypothetical protein